jgi:hypothetical protein
LWHHGIERLVFEAHRRNPVRRFVHFQNKMLYLSNIVTLGRRVLQILELRPKQRCRTVLRRSAQSVKSCLITGATIISLGMAAFSARRETLVIFTTLRKTGGLHQNDATALLRTIESCS